jgi:UDP-glucose 4-epimerase
LKILITGGAGYIGSTVASACTEAGMTPVIIDNLSTGSEDFVLGRHFYRGDFGDTGLLSRIFADHEDIAAVVHCAALLIVGDSVQNPLSYYRENVAKTIDLVNFLMVQGCSRLLFSSSAAVYHPRILGRVDETAELGSISPYGHTKIMVEQILRDVSGASSLRVMSLRYFNPIGADPRLRTGPDLRSATHALGRLVQAYESGGTFRITGALYPTRDGTGIRDYLHVWDLANGHVAALRNFDEVLPPSAGGRFEAINLGSGTGVTVRELLQTFNHAIGRSLKVEQAGPRSGDVAGCYASNDKALHMLCWRPELSLADGIRTALAWTSRRKSSGTMVGMKV